MNDLLDDYSKGSDNYPQNRLQALMWMDHYSNAPTAITNSEGTAFAQNGGKTKKGKGDKDKAKSHTPKDPKNFDTEWWKDKECYRCGKKGHSASACSVKPSSDDDDKSSRSSTSSSKAMTEIQKSMKTMGKAMTHSRNNHTHKLVRTVRDKEDYVYAQPTAATRQSVISAHYVQPQVC